MSHNPVKQNPRRSPPTRISSYSNIPRPTSKLETVKISSPKQSTPRVILGADGRPSKATPAKQEATVQKQRNVIIEEHSTDNVAVVPDVLPLHQIVQRLPPMIAFSIDQRKVFKELLNTDADVTITSGVQSELSQANTTTQATLFEISNASQEDQSRFLVGDNTAIDAGLETLPSQAVFSVVHDEEMLPDSSKGDGQRLRKLTASSSFMNICESDKKKQEGKRAGIPWCWVAGILLMFIITIFMLCLPLILLTYRVEFLERSAEQSFGRNLLLWIFTKWEQVKAFLTADI
ncbi:uncharacterized protein LOC131685154 [Topomyia yanbarensis]|uniref:uncharacterized protein LOC131685154 n=1 Tax=Topomyia yanbarensis TaxID=2498891 RepID=UPI00273B76B3|nr:uncharacterized protein LOC131685154 [Topomyia yanbarensis]